MPLLHFTRTPEAVGNVLSVGFVYVAHPTKVADFLLPRMPDQPREPQQFGIVSFRFEEEGTHCAKHRAKYGPFAISIDVDWAKSVGAMPVRYVRRWSLFAFMFKRNLARAAKPLYAEMARYPDDAFRVWSFHNANVAAYLGAKEYAALILLYQYMAPSKDRWEKEWRIPMRRPFYSIPMTARDAVAAVSPPKGWAKHVNVLKPPTYAVCGLVCPHGTRTALLEYVPEDLRSLPIREEETGFT
jgi:hypothetical protein